MIIIGGLYSNSVIEFDGMIFLCFLPAFYYALPFVGFVFSLPWHFVYIILLIEFLFYFISCRIVMILLFLNILS